MLVNDAAAPFAIRVSCGVVRLGERTGAATPAASPAAANTAPNTTYNNNLDSSGG